MSPLKNINTLTSASVEDYMKLIYAKCECDIFNNSINKQKIEDEILNIPTITNYKKLVNYNYNINQLKTFVKYYKLKMSGNKKELLYRIFIYLHLSSYIIKIQKIVRGNIQRKYNKLHGPAYKNRNLCTNVCDFMTLETWNELSFDNFISYKDTDNFIYGFNISSLYNLINKSEKEPLNPYNRNIISNNVLKNIKSLIRLSKALNLKINLNIEDDTLNVSSEKAIELRALSLFQKIDSLGNYSNPQWFLSLNRFKLLKYVRELADIWNYRAQLSIETKLNICPQFGDPFRNLSIPYINYEPNINNVKKVILEVLENLVNSGVDKDSKSLGSYYVLGALTLVNESAALSLPWLYQSFNYF